MKFRLLPPAAALVVVSLLGCEQKSTVVVPATPVPEPVAKTKTLETARLGSAIDAYERSPGAASQAEVRKALADLDSEIAELELLVARRTGADRDEAAAKLKNLRAYRAAEMARFTAAEGKGAVVPTAAPDARSGAEKVEDAARRTGNAIEDAAQKTGDAVKDALR